ncbi:hypothetical protein A3C60_02190 [Candidatus Nomurabacteria bacterium RIFCSPHIGHO2_02_FULL_37_45]|uniref:Uncharacterized protein n=2 Tax=Candidatus Nomuraibacteriota TaxID=1752729 RepID=A0A1F6Y338_9BACT|nr:MAG: hypothetical protein A2727_00965 [Candidatus Nomurabacteria bacterium RIFCSPHIGHO2_01_FULL_37_110]OGI72350.1 MAG: hypothetical protein A3C60_02190 [Candidatus Nomurabacteria bacterium RIFCSPHIGHO2_02_FULL_37_45]OGI79232.1 MAG: hypothetical protein A3F19_02065 [Candidatus Nomurabacteria bacterium RIFCSPHIGHO2_12_FULL_37_29]OGI85088.1 MAG: hypothetical protein A3A92_01465 [Candidatus Nomurabacteria bacterium RIFCSPLOWO2_01_FULL_37_49]OGJ00801.1 MAG: hypothetical protein A3G98_01900 [Candi
MNQFTKPPQLPENEDLPPGMSILIERFGHLMDKLPLEKREQVVRSLSEMITGAIVSPPTEKNFAARLREIMEANIRFLEEEGKAQ